MPDAITWFEVPARDVDRAAAFYSEVLGIALQRFDGMPDAALFGHEGPGVGGEIRRGEPSPVGTIVYLAAPGGVADALSRVEAAGGKVLTPKTSIGDHGWIGIIQDTEGNRVGLHNMEG